jgi:hypothetical protein
MANIPSDILKIEDARHWCRVNGYSVEATEGMVAEWSGNPLPVEEVLEASPEPEVEEWEEDEEDEWEYEEEDEDSEEDEE